MGLEDKGKKGCLKLNFISFIIIIIILFFAAFYTMFNSCPLFRPKWWPVISFLRISSVFKPIP